jgi:hypothetical protein
LNPSSWDTAAINQQKVYSFNKCGDTTYLITQDEMQVEINVRCYSFYPFNWIEGIIKLLKNIKQYIFLIFFTTFCLKMLLAWTITEYLCHKGPCMFSFSRNHYPVLSSFMTCHRICNKSNRTGATCGSWAAYPSVISVRLDFRRHFLLYISSLISSQVLSKVFWKFKIWLPVHSEANFVMDGLCQIN